MTAEKIHRVASIGQVILGGIVLAVQVVGLFRGRRVQTDVRPETT